MLRVRARCLVLGVCIEPYLTTVIPYMNVALTQREREVAADWIQLQKLDEATPEYQELAQAAIDLDRLMLRDKDSFWRIVCEICVMSNDEWVLANIAAGPIESYLGCYGETAVEHIADAARDSARFRSALDGVWKNQMSSATWGALQRIRAK